MNINKSIKLTCYVKSYENNTHIDIVTSFQKENEKGVKDNKRMRITNPKFNRDSLNSLRVYQLSGSTGLCGFSKGKRGTAYAAEELTRRLFKEFEESIKISNLIQLVHVNLVLDGYGQGRLAVAKIIGKLGYSISLISDVSPLNHNGCRPKKPRRI
jgi:ribosomal protein S11